MVIPVLTSAYAGVFGVIFFALSLWVVLGRLKFRVIHGDGGKPFLNRRIRAHANFAEYVPFILFLVALLEASGSGPTTVHALLLPLVIVRIAHPFGMLAPESAPAQYIFRGASIVVTFAILVISSVLLLTRAL
jgi:uncharacterized membrane protein YecN with MAPEG domain